MIAVPMFNMNGERVGAVEVDPEEFGGRVRPQLIKQAVVTYLEHQRQYSARTKGRGHKAGSTRKLYRQKGTGNARMGTIRTPIRRGGGRAFACRAAQPHLAIPKKMRRMARNSAILAKLLAEDVVVVDELTFSQPKTKQFAGMLQALGIDGGCVVALAERDDNTYRSGRNIPRTEIRVVGDLNAYEVLRRKKLVFTKSAIDRLRGDSHRREQLSDAVGN